MNTVIETERRQSLRLPYDGPVEIETPARGGWISGHGRDLSEGGLSVRLNERFDLHTLVRVRLLPGAGAPAGTGVLRTRTPVECLARVAWTTARMDLTSQPPYPYDIGIEFVTVPPPIRRQLTITYERLRQRQQPPTAVPRLRPALIGGQRYAPSLTYEGIPRPAWHLIVEAEGVPCFAQRFGAAARAVAGWRAFKQGRESSLIKTRRARRKHQ